MVNAFVLNRKEKPEKESIGGINWTPIHLRYLSDTHSLVIFSWHFP